MWLGKMPSFSLEGAQSLMLDAVHLGGEHQMPEIQKSVRTTPPHFMVFNPLRSTYRFSQQCIHLSARTSTGPGCSCPHDLYHGGVGHSPLRVRELLYC
jgi:hypothetical protein